MEETNNTTNPDISNQPIQTPITPEPTPSKPNLFKYLFIISLLILLAVIISFYFIFTNKISKSSSIQSSNNNISQTVPTTVNIPTINSNENNDTSYKSYSIGDEITFNNEKWYVIKSSGSDQDYVTVIKAIYLVNQFAYYHCAPEDIIGEFHDNCSKMKNDYSSSYAKKYLEQTYLPTLGASNLKEVNGYKIRLITLDELQSLGCSSIDQTCKNAPNWLQYDGINPNGSSDYWTMTEAKSDPISPTVWNVSYCGSNSRASIICENVLSNTTGTGSTLELRPVVNLIKSNIQP